MSKRPCGYTQHLKVRDVRPSVSSKTDQARSINSNASSSLPSAARTMASTASDCACSRGTIVIPSWIDERLANIFLGLGDLALRQPEIGPGLQGQRVGRSLLADLPSQFHGTFGHALGFRRYSPQKFAHGYQVEQQKLFHHFRRGLSARRTRRSASSKSFSVPRIAPWRKWLRAR